MQKSLSCGVHNVVAGGRALCEFVSTLFWFVFKLFALLRDGEEMQGDEIDRMKTKVRFLGHLLKRENILK